MALASSSIVTKALMRSEEHTSELQSRLHLVCRLLLEKKKIQVVSTHRVALAAGVNAPCELYASTTGRRSHSRTACDATRRVSRFSASGLRADIHWFD